MFVNAALVSRWSSCLTLLTLAALWTVPAARGGIISLLQNNVLGAPQFHKQQPWPFDPSAGARLAPEFAALHGEKSERLIERIGLGVDGRQYERREQQQVRDFLYDQQQRQLDAQQQQPQFASPELRFPDGYNG